MYIFGQNSIQTTVLELAYDSKTSAVHNNLLIESLFDKHILPELQNAVAKEIPQGALLELSKLEIDIGTIDENRLEDELPTRIGNAVGKALRNTTKINENLFSRSFATPGLNDYAPILTALELYLVHGYFPIWADPSETLENMIHQSLLDHRDRLVRLLYKLGCYDSVTRRLGYGLNSKVFNRLLKAIQPMNSEWIRALEHWFLKIDKAYGVKGWSRKEFIENTRFLILKHLLHTPDVAFNRINFLNHLMDAMARVFQLDGSVLIQHIKDESTLNNSEAGFVASLQKLLSSKNSIFESYDVNDRQRSSTGRVRDDIDKFWESVSKGVDGKPSRVNGHRSQLESTQEIFLEYSRRVVEQYLKKGQLREPYSDLTQKEVLWLFRQLLKRRDNYLIRELRPLANKKWIADRLDALCTVDNLKKKDDAFSPATFLNGSKRTKAIINQLYSFIPRPPVNDEHRRLYKYAIWRCAILCYLRQQKYTPKAFAVEIGQSFRQMFMEKNAVGILEIIVDQMGAFGSIAHEVLEVFLSPPGQKKSLVKSAPKLPETTTIVGSQTEPHSKGVSFYLSLIRFFTHHGILPWWSSAPVFSGVLDEIEKMDPEDAQILSEKLLQPQKREFMVTQLLPRLSPIESSKLGRVLPELVPWVTSLKNGSAKSRPEQKLGVNKKPMERRDGSLHWEELFDNTRKNQESLFKVLYAMDDHEILERWGASNPHAAKQAAAYTSLSTYFHFREVSPMRWRKIVYEFTYAYYRKGSPKESGQYHVDLLKHLISKHHKVDWVALLSSVRRRIEDAIGQNSSLFPMQMAELIKNSASGPKRVKNSDINGIEQEFITQGNTDIRLFNAGLILFWPFLTRFFEHLSLLKEGGFVDERCRNEAVYLLQYLAYNEIDFPEHQLVLNKVLVGMSQHEVLLPVSRLSKVAEKTAQSLLKGLIGNWEKVKDSSPAAIQETFLQREGILTIKENGLLLQIDKKGVDVLLTSLPWNITPIKLPWMKNPLHVDWV